MKHRMLFATLLVIVSAVVAGCLSSNVVLTFTPNPIVLHPGDSAIKGTLELKLTGFGVVTIDKVSIAVLDAHGNVVVRPDTDEPIVETIDVGVTIPAFGIGHSQEISIPVGYDEVKNLGIRGVRLSVTGTKTADFTITIELAAGD